MIWDHRPKDFWGDAWPNPSGHGFHAVFRLPWQSRAVVLCGPDRKPHVFTKREAALQAVLNHLCNLMCPHITAGGSQASDKAKEDAEALFAKGGDVGSVH